ncbi:MAG: carboxymuconolactone decarboxylase family protein [Planctomycetota bacterium]
MARPAGDGRAACPVVIAAEREHTMSKEFGMQSNGMKTAAAALLGAAAALALAAGPGDRSAKSGAAPWLETERGFPIHTRASAPSEAKEVLEWYEANFQMVPHLAGVMADSPALSRSYWQLQNNLQSMGSLTPPENNIVQMAIAFENECQYCVAGHTAAGRMFFNSPEVQLEALRSGSALPDKKFDALRDFALAVSASKGRVSESQLASFYAAGYTRTHALDVVANVAAKVMSNYTNQIALTPMDDAFEPLARGLPFEEDRELIER